MDKLAAIVAATAPVTCNMIPSSYPGAMKTHTVPTPLLWSAVLDDLAVQVSEHAITTVATI